MALPNEFFTPESILTLTGAAAATTIVTNVCQHVFNWNPKWLGLILGIALAILGAAMTEQPNLITWIIAVFNGFLIYATSSGVMQMTGTNPPTPGPNADAGQVKRKLWNKWY